MDFIRQPLRLLIVVIYIASLFVFNYCLSGYILPSIGVRGIWFFSGIAVIILGALLSEPFFTKPVDAIANSMAAISVLYFIDLKKYPEVPKVSNLIRILLIIYVSVIILLSILAICFKESKFKQLKSLSKIFTKFSSDFGSVKLIFSSIFFFAVFFFHLNNTKEVISLIIFWLIIVLAEPFQRFHKYWLDIKKLWGIKVIEEELGTLIGIENPCLAIIKLNSRNLIPLMTLIAVDKSDEFAEVGMVIDNFSLQDEYWSKVILLDIKLSIKGKKSFWGKNSIFTKEGSVWKLNIDSLDTSKKDNILKNEIYSNREKLIGFVLENSNVSEITFEILSDKHELFEGRLVNTKIGKQEVLYQIINGITKREILESKNLHGYLTGKARKIGYWDEDNKGFKNVRWVPQIFSPVYIIEKRMRKFRLESVGIVPSTDYFITIDTDNLVTHNTAILGILGIGKTYLAYELITRILKDNIKVICLDITGQYKVELKDFYNEENENDKYIKICKEIEPFKEKVDKNVCDGGNWNQFKSEIIKDLNEFLLNENDYLKIYNPEAFDVWRQDSRPFQGSASMAPLTIVEITRYITESLLEVLQKELVQKAKVCIVFEEAHSLIPEWNSTSNEGDRTACNGTAKAILQGRKYGLGCILITQRTANVTKSILNQCNTVFAMRVFDATGIEFLKNYIGEEYTAVLSTLEDRHSVIFGRASSSIQPIIIELNNRDEFKKSYHPTINLQKN